MSSFGCLSSFEKSTLLLLYINDLPDDIFQNFAIYGDDATLYSKCDQASDMWQQLELASELESDLQDCVDCGRKCLLVSMLERLSLFCSTGLTTLVLLMRKWMGLFFRKKTSFEISKLSFSSGMNWGSYIISVTKFAFKKIGASIRSINVVSTLFLFKSTITLALHGILFSCVGGCS